jgi:protein-disulfide isomerase
MTRRRLGIVIASAAAVAAALIAASQLGARDAREPVAQQSGLFAGIPQHGLALGRDDAPVTLVEYADLQCPYCAQWSAQSLPTLVEHYVRAGKLRMVFRGLAFIGPDSETALRTAIAAGRDGRLWDVVHGLYGRQGHENLGWVTDDVLDEVAVDAGLDGETLSKRRGDPWVDTELDAARALAQAAGVQGTPAFQIGRTGGPLERVQPKSLDPEGITPAIDALLRP